MAPIGQPPLAEQHLLNTFEIWGGDPRGRQPHWLPWFAFNREEFSSSILRYDCHDGSRHHYRFVVATMNPLLAVVESLGLPVDCLSDREWLDLPAVGGTWDHHCVRRIGVMRYSATGAIDDTNANVYVL